MIRTFTEHSEQILNGAKIALTVLYCIEKLGTICFGFVVATKISFCELSF